MEQVGEFWNLYRFANCRSYRYLYSNSDWLLCLQFSAAGSAMMIVALLRWHWRETYGNEYSESLYALV